MSISLELKPETQLLMKGRAQIEKGWCKHALSDDEGNVCALGAILPLHSGPWITAFSFLDEYAKNNHYSSIVHLNNAPETTKEDVLKGFDWAIAQSMIS